MNRLCTVLVLLLSSCAYVEATSRPYDGVERFMPINPNAVRILPGEPKERHDRLGEVLLDISLDPLPAPEDVAQRLREEAGKMGANGIYIVRDSTTPRDGHKVVGIAIRFRQ